MQTISAGMLQLLLGAVLAALIALISWRMHWLKISGAWAAFGIGAVVFGLGGFPWAVVLLTFFISSSILSILFAGRKKTAEQYYEKSSQRDAGQVLANGFFAGIFAVLHAFFPDSWLPWTGFAAALAAATADTWATELGTLSTRSPILISTGKQVPKGTSGGVSLAGTAASLAGSTLIAIVAWLFWPGSFHSTSSLWIILVVISGLAGSLFDSLLGAIAQAIYFCPACQKETEQPRRHSCGTETRFLKGLPWLDNDWVNIFCTGMASSLSLIIVYFALT